jgi:hypothetical protein
MKDLARQDRLKAPDLPNFTCVQPKTIRRW